MFLKKLFLATAVTTALAGAAVGMAACGEEGHQHEYQWKTDKEATCTENGIQTGTCTHEGCGATIQVQTPALGHATLSAVAEKQPESCGQPGNRAYWTCSRCNGIFTDAQGLRQVTKEEVEIRIEHNMIKVGGFAATCTTDGRQDYYKCVNCEGTFSDAEGKTAVTMDALTVKAHHTASKVEAVAATCTNNGVVAHYKCEICQKTFSDEACTTEIKDLVELAKGHKPEKHDAKAATCTDDGNILYYTCSECGGTFTDENCAAVVSAESVVIPAAGHKIVHTDAAPATCNSYGVAEHWYCTVCQKNFRDKDGTVEYLDEDGNKESVMLPYAHRFNTITEGEAATCDKEGSYDHATCEDCHRSFLRTSDDGTWFQYYDEKDTKIPALGHVLGQNLIQRGDEDLAKEYAPTCTEAGWVLVYECTDCNKFFADVEATKEATVKKTIDNTDVNSARGPKSQLKEVAPEGFKILAADADADPDTEPSEPTNGRPTQDELEEGYVEGKGLAVAARGHMTECRTDDKGEEHLFYHPTRDGHFLYCRRPCCKDENGSPKRIIESNETEDIDEKNAQARDGEPDATTKHELVAGSDFGTVEKHNYENGVCKQCGWIDTSLSNVTLNYTTNKGDNENKECSIDPTLKGNSVWQNHYYTYENDTDEDWYREGISKNEKEIVLGANEPDPLYEYPTMVFNSIGILDLTKIFTEEEVEQGYTLVGIGTCTFYNTYMDAVIIPWTVRYIDTNAFARCMNLKYVIFEEAPEGREDEAELYINSGAFDSAGYNTGSYTWYLTQIMFPKHLKAIATSNASFTTTALANIVINSDVKEIVPDTMDIQTDGKGNEVVPNIFRDKTYSGGVKETKVFATLEKDDMGEYKPTVYDWNKDSISSYKFYYFGDLSGDEVEWAERYYDTDAKQWADIVD